MQDSFRVQSIIANYFELFGIKDYEEVKSHILFCISSRYFVIRPRSVTMMLRTNKERHDKFKSSDIMLKC